MAASFVTLFQWRLNSMLIQENEILLGVKDQIQSFITQLDAAGSFTGDVGMILGRESCHGSWASELRGMLHQAEDFVDDFIIRAYGQTEKDRKDSIAEFGKKLENFKSSISEILNRRRPPVETTMMLEEIQQFLSSNFVFDEGKETYLVSCMLNYINLPYDLKLSLLFCCAFLGRYGEGIDDLIRVLVATGLIQEKTGELMEDRAQENIDKLISLGMLEEKVSRWDFFRVRSPYYQLCLSVMKVEDFFLSSANSDCVIPPTARHVSIHDADNTIPNINSFLRSLFVSPNDVLSEASSDCLRNALHNAKLVRVLDLQRTRFKSLPDDVGKLVQLRYLGLRHSDITKLPDSVSNLRNLQTLDMYWSGHKFELSNGVLNLAQLRHLKMFRPANDGEVRVPQGISRLRNLQTLEGVYAGGGIAKDLGTMTQLRSLEVRRVWDDHADELYLSVMKLSMLRKLSLTVERERGLYNSRSSSLEYENSIFPCLESFSPPPLLQTIVLEGRLIEMPLWLGSMENLTRLYIRYSHLSENPTTILQFLPNLKYLEMFKAYKGRRMEKEFFRAGGFPKLECLYISSDHLVEWTEIEEGALPCLKQLSIYYSQKLMVLPEGLQHVTTLQILDIWNVHEDLIRRLSPHGGPENYKIKHIPLVQYEGDMSSGFWGQCPPQ